MTTVRTATGLVMTQGRDCTCQGIIMTQIKTASGPMLWFMNLMGYAGWTSFWNTVYFAPGKRTEALLRHEMTHINQIEKDGYVKFTIKYLYWSAKHGYDKNPYEVAARLAQYKLKD